MLVFIDRRGVACYHDREYCKKPTASRIDCFLDAGCRLAKAYLLKLQPVVSASSL